jgi:hypothetical protein
LPGATTALAQSDFTGTWEVAVREFGQKNFYLPMADGRLTVQQQAAAIPPSYNQQADVFGPFGKRRVAPDLRKMAASPVANSCCGGRADRLTGSGTLQDIPSRWTASALSSRPARPTVHGFNPQHFYTFFSGAIPPPCASSPATASRPTR